VIGLAIHREVGCTQKHRDTWEHENVNVKNRFAIHSNTKTRNYKDGSMGKDSAELVVLLEVHREVGCKTKQQKTHRTRKRKEPIAKHNTTKLIKRKKWPIWRVKENSQVDWRSIARSAAKINTENHKRKTR